jgi:O-antigen ligase
MLVCAFILTNWATYQYLLLGGPIALVYYLIPGLLAIPLLAAHPSLLLRLIRDPLVIWFVAYVMTGLLWLLFFGNFLDVETRQWRLRLLSFFIFFTGLALASESNRALLAKVILLCAAVASINIWFDFLFPSNFVPVGLEFSNPGRGAGLFINANQAGTAVIAMVVAALPFLDRRIRGTALSIMLFGIFPTFSRSAMLFGPLVVVLAAVLGMVDRKQLIWMVVLIVVLAVAGESLYEFGADSNVSYLSNIQGRLDFFMYGGEALDDSADERRYVLSEAWRMFAESPIVGNGIGSTLVEGYGRGTHNMYLMLAAEQGILGVVLYLMFVLLTLIRGWRLFKWGAAQQDRDVGGALICLAAFFAFIGLFSHNLLEDPSTMFLLSFLLAARQAAFRKPAARNSQGWFDRPNGPRAAGAPP